MYVQATSKLVYSTMKNTSMTMSNMIGPVEKMALANHPVSGLYFTASGVPQVSLLACFSIFITLSVSHIINFQFFHYVLYVQSLTVALISYVGTLRATIATEEGLIDPNKLKIFIQKAYDNIFEAAIPSGC